MKSNSKKKTWCPDHKVKTTLVKGKYYCGECCVLTFNHYTRPIVTYSSLFKETYSDAIHHLIPEGTKLMKLLPLPKKHENLL